MVFCLRSCITVALVWIIGNSNQIKSAEIQPTKTESQAKAKVEDNREKMKQKIADISSKMEASEFSASEFEKTVSEEKKKSFPFGQS